MSGHLINDEWTSIQIEGPLPMSVAGALMTTIGTMWPDARIMSNSGSGLHMLIPKGQAAQSVDEEFIEQIRKGAELAPEQDGDFLGFQDGWIAFAPPEELCLHLGSVAHAIMQGYPQEITNHLEWTVRTGNEPDDPQYVLSISRSKEQTPLAMRKEAEAEVERLGHALDIMQGHEIENRRLRALLEEHGIDPS